MSTIFPYFLTRIGGEPIEILEQLSRPEAYAKAENLSALSQEIEKLGKEISDDLFEEIGTLEQEELQKELLNVKRSVFNGRNIGLPVAIDHISDKTAGKIRQYIATQEKLIKAEEAYVSSFPGEMAQAREGVKKAVASEPLKLGISLSSHILLANLERIVKRPADSFRKKELKAEESILKYLTRTSAKTSPFSFFTQLAMGKVDGEGFIAEKNGMGKGNSTLNNHLLSFFKSVLVEIPEIADRVNVRLNPTVTYTNGQILYLTNNNNVEAFQRIEENPLIELFTDFFGKEYPDGLALGDAIAKLVEGEYVDAGPDELRGFIQSLFSYGLLEWDFGISGIDPFWDKKLVTWLSGLNIETPAVDIAKEALIEARIFAESFSEIQAEKRYKELKLAFEAFKGRCLKLHELAGLPEDERLDADERAAKIKAEQEKKEKEDNKEEESDSPPFKHTSTTYFHFRQEQFLYEDVEANADVTLGNDDAQALVAPVRRLCHALRNFEGFEPEQERMAAFFEEKFGEGPVSLLEFYEQYYRDVKVPEHKAMEQFKEERKKNKDAKPPELKYKAEKTAKKREKAKAALVEWLKQNSELEHGKININTEGLNTADVKDKTFSMAMFIQPYHDDKKIKGVVNSMFPGYGKMFSRFLHLFPSELTEALIQANTSGEGNKIYVENTDASYFNANLHPPLMPYEINTPGGHNTLEPKQQISVTDLLVAPNSEGGLKLVHSQRNKEVSLFDLGFQGHKGRSELYQLLTRFTDAEMLGLNPLFEMLSEVYPIPEGEPKPEVWLDDTVCVNRRSWKIPKDQLPELPNHWGEAECYKAIIDWKNRLRLPDEVFIKITNHQELETLDYEVVKEIGRDAYKPQYLDFRQLPMVCNLFKKLLSKVPIQLAISEMKPNAGEMIATKEGRFVTELMMQWYE
ncbi:lantibiotic dehydratase [Luteibaculum oceani]|uniref:Lantibiotic dehydratase N-terminal domain-containing protein n=1 Tax=Luteibaculum oceani TaxID=1294296 RepID=A0A5C6VKK0_9FLAO|nr:lantibiotic dehydratase [Luteibaculum oceani]TXC85241.1 hypothetical protein FRX97_01050 [Luteibaculum oceani]